ncbi:EscU/YscU/HrcU family type III secretion system export apparatus switch protein, partial [uncultured Desulfovibrio sp.]
MFGAQKDPSRTEPATPKRIRKQRQEGNVPKSAELGKAVSLTGGMLVLSVWIGPMSESIKNIFRRFLVHSWEFDPNPQNVYILTQELMLELCKIIMPILLFLAFVGFLAQRIQVGKLWTTKV